jgi:catechol 2,3-dioxygenase-like lactoylglutathione lyase family enzyme
VVVRLHYVGLRVNDLTKSLRFYTRVLGLRVKVRGDDVASGRGVWVGLEDPRSKARLELNWYPPGSTYATQYRPGDALDHIGFILGAVPRSKLNAEYGRLLRGGAGRTELTPERTAGWMACVTDPDGNWIELFRLPTAAERRRARLGETESRSNASAPGSAKRSRVRRAGRRRVSRH